MVIGNLVPGVMASAAKLTLVLGGARSGKSRFAEGLIAAMQRPPWTYVATAEALDAEMAERIGAHRARRGPQWRTIEAPRDLAAALRGCKTSVLVDCLTLWLSNLMLAGADIEAATAGLEDALDEVADPVVLVANEVGSGLVPEHALGRKFRDLQGVLNQRMAARADRVVLLVAGLPMILKGAL